MQIAESIFTVSVIMCGCFGSIALDNSKRLLSSPRILCNPYLKKQKAHSEETVFALNTHHHLWALDPLESSHTHPFPYELWQHSTLKPSGFYHL